MSCHCQHRHQYLPSWMDGSFFTLLYCTTAWRWRRRSVHVIVCIIAFCHWLAKWMGGGKKTPAKDIFCWNKTPSLLKLEVYQAAQDSFWNNESHDFLQLLQLLYTLNDTDHAANVKSMLLKWAPLLCESILDHSLHYSGDRKDPRKLILIWYTGASYGLTLFRSDFIDYTKLYILGS